MISNSSGKKNCFNCNGDNHWVINCPDLSAAERADLAGMALITLDNKIEGVSFLQSESSLETK